MSRVLLGNLHVGTASCASPLLRRNLPTDLVCSMTTAWTPTDLRGAYKAMHPTACQRLHRLIRDRQLLNTTKNLVSSQKITRRRSQPPRKAGNTSEVTRLITRPPNLMGRRLVWSYCKSDEVLLLVIRDSADFNRSANFWGPHASTEGEQRNSILRIIIYILVPNCKMPNYYCHYAKIFSHHSCSQISTLAENKRTH